MADYSTDFSTLVENLKSNAPECVKAVYGNFKIGLCPNLQYVTIDFLDKSDWPHNIPENSIALKFRIDLAAKVIECTSSGHIWLTQEDQKVSYMAMATVKQYAKVYSDTVKKCPWFRKTKFASPEDAAAKILKFVEKVREVLAWATDGYPYKTAKVNIYC